MFELMNKLDKDIPIGVAISGGVDSVALAHYLMSKRYNITLYFFDHMNDYGNVEFKFVTEFAEKYELPLMIGWSNDEKPADMSQEEFWRTERIKFFKSIPMTVATGHTLNDAAEWFLFTAFNGEGHLMPYTGHNTIKPFLLTSKTSTIGYCIKNKVLWLEDPSNSNPEFAMRNRIRCNILPEVLMVNPGFLKVIKKKLIKKWRNE